ncbi:rhodanese-like domain-containing protein [Streptomyces sp. NPDC058289]|uniref:rhodanese-like domain-containing protein n=1 Tax=Streptomyces sp. NPDC058289 TaxID=3346425 RepID=UPI0036E3FBA5
MNSGPLPSVAASALPSEAFVLDVRENDEWAAGHAEGALHIPMSEFVARIGELTEKIEDERPVYVMCRVGGRSAQVAQYLRSQDIDAVNVAGGMQDWEAAGRPVVTDAGTPGFVV